MPEQEKGRAVIASLCQNRRREEQSSPRYARVGEGEKSHRLVMSGQQEDSSVHTTRVHQQEGHTAGYIPPGTPAGGTQRGDDTSQDPQEEDTTRRCHLSGPSGEDTTRR